MRLLISKAIARIIYKVIDSKEYKNIVEQKREKEKAIFIKSFRSLGESFHIPQPFLIKNPQYISIGNNFVCLYNLRLEAWDEYEEDKFNPEIIIGDNVSINTDVHIGCIDRVSIGNNVMMASRIYISDHFHGEINLEALSVSPAKRRLCSKGPVIIEDNVWIGEGVCIFPGVTVGKNAIIGANAVVTKNIPPNSVAVGVPARILKILDL